MALIWQWNYLGYGPIRPWQIYPVRSSCCVPTTSTYCLGFTWASCVLNFCHVDSTSVLLLVSQSMSLGYPCPVLYRDSEFTYWQMPLSLAHPIVPLESEYQVPCRGCGSSGQQMQGCWLLIVSKNWTKCYSLQPPSFLGTPLLWPSFFTGWPPWLSSAFLASTYGVLHPFLVSSYGSLHFDLHLFLVGIYGGLNISSPNFLAGRHLKYGWPTDVPGSPPHD